MNNLQPTVVDACPPEAMASAYALAGYYTGQLRDLAYPQKPPKPVKAETESWAHFGKRMDQYEQHDLQAYFQAISLYNLNQARLYSWFQRDLLQVVGVAGHPKAACLYGIAWDKGHAAGLHEVAQWADELSILLKEESNA